MLDNINGVNNGVVGHAGVHGGIDLGRAHAAMAAFRDQLAAAPLPAHILQEQVAVLQRQVAVLQRQVAVLPWGVAPVAAHGGPVPMEIDLPAAQ